MVHALCSTTLPPSPTCVLQDSCNGDAFLAHMCAPEQAELAELDERLESEFEVRRGCVAP